MILFDGKLYDSSMQKQLLEELEKKINQTRMKAPLLIETVLNAGEKLKEEVQRGKFDFLAEELDAEMRGMLDQLLPLLDKENLRKRIELELPEIKQFDELAELRRMPLGTLFHIAAGNMDGLPAYSVFEGLLSGNINILKLPSVDSSLSISVLYHLIEIEPLLKEYIYVFDTPSSDVESLYKMASVSDGLIVWGSDQAVSAIRKLAPSGIKLIEWGHRISFAYISVENLEEKEKDWQKLAKHLAQSRQRYCSSVQVIYLDSDSYEKAEQFIRLFLPIMDREFKKNGQTLAEQGEMTLRKTYDHLSRVIQEENPEGRIYWGEVCSILLKKDQKLEGCGISNQIVVKCLPNENLLEVLREKKGVLQSAGLICEKDRFERLSRILINSGVNRILHAEYLSSYHLFDSHDGEFPLSRYTRIINCEKQETD